MPTPAHIPATRNRIFTSRPKRAGLWVRLTLADGSEVDGTIPEDLRLCEPWKGITMTPTVLKGTTVTYRPEQVVACVVLGSMGLGHPEAHVLSGTVSARKGRWAQ